MDKIIFKQGPYRIVEIQDQYYDIDGLKGDCFCPSTNNDIDLNVLKKQEQDFENNVYNNGVFGYILEKWNPEIGIGYEVINSCYGFIGTHAIENHYIVSEFLEQIKG